MQTISTHLGRTSMGHNIKYEAQNVLCCGAFCCQSVNLALAPGPPPLQQNPSWLEPILKVVANEYKIFKVHLVYLIKTS
jgi:hypothetical protein